MPENFTQYLIISLIALLFADKYIPAVLKKWFGVEVKNGNGDKRIDILEGHAKIANEEMGEVKERLIAIETKVDIVIKHLKI